MVTTNRYLRAQLPTSGEMVSGDFSGMDEARVSEEERYIRAQSRLLAVSKSPSKKSMQLQKILKSINVTARVPGQGSIGHAVRSDAKKRNKAGVKGSMQASAGK